LLSKGRGIGMSEGWGVGRHVVPGVGPLLPAREAPVRTWAPGRTGRDSHARRPGTPYRRGMRTGHPCPELGALVQRSRRRGPGQWDDRRSPAAGWGGKRARQNPVASGPRRGAPAGLGIFTVATFGQSLHWMDGDVVASTAKAMLRNGGALVHISDLKTEIRTVDGLPYPAVPYSAIRSLTRQYLGAVQRAGRGVLLHGTPGDEAAVLTRAGFSGPQRHVVQGGQRWNALARMSPHGCSHSRARCDVWAVSPSWPCRTGPGRRRTHRTRCRAGCG
jgi:hypothetical protein